MNESPGFWSVLGQLIPIALAGTFSWMPVTGVVILLLSRGGRAKAPVFFAGRVLGLAVITVAFVAGARALPPAPSLDGPIVAGVETLVGLVLVVVGVLTWRGRHDDRRRKQPAWLERLGEASAPAVFVTSLIVDLQPKGLLLGLASGAVVRGGSLPFVEAVLAVAIYLAVAASSVLLPILATYVSPRRTDRLLRRGQQWLTEHGSVVAAVLVAAVGVVLVVDGIRRF